MVVIEAGRLITDCITAHLVERTGGRVGKVERVDLDAVLNRRNAVPGYRCVKVIRGDDARAEDLNPEIIRVEAVHV